MNKLMPTSSWAGFPAIGSYAVFTTAAYLQYPGFFTLTNKRITIISRLVVTQRELHGVVFFIEPAIQTLLITVLY